MVLFKFERWIQRIQQAISNKLAPVLDKNKVLLPQTVYTSQGINENFTLTKISNFNSLIALSQEHQTPVYALNAKQLGYTGQVLIDYQKKQEEFKTTFPDLADKIIGLTSAYAVSLIK